MKIGFVLVTAMITWVMVYGPPFSDKKPQLDHYYNSPAPILPMTFAHKDHTSVSCIDCHHNYVDDTGRELCMFCHVTDEEVWPLLEDQFHTLCRGCHIELAAKGEKAGPTRQCVGCHLTEEFP